MSSLNLIFKLSNNMSPANFRYVLLKRSFFQNMKEKILHHLNTLKPRPELTKTKVISKHDWLNIRHYGFWKYYIVVFSEVFCGCSYVRQNLSHFHRPIKNYGHLNFGLQYYQLLKLLYLGNHKRSQSGVLELTTF